MQSPDAVRAEWWRPSLRAAALAAGRPAADCWEGAESPGCFWWAPGGADSWEPAEPIGATDAGRALAAEAGWWPL